MRNLSKHNIYNMFLVKFIFHFAKDGGKDIKININKTMIEISNTHLSSPLFHFFSKPLSFLDSQVTVGHFSKNKSFTTSEGWVLEISGPKHGIFELQQLIKVVDSKIAFPITSVFSWVRLPCHRMQIVEQS